MRAEAQAVSDLLDGVQAGPDALREGARLWFRAMEDVGRVRILLVDGPAVLGPSEMARIDAETGGASLADGLVQALPGTAPARLAALSDILSAGFDRAALRIAEGAEAQPYHDAIEALIQRQR